MGEAARLLIGIIILSIVLSFSSLTVCMINIIHHNSNNSKEE